MSKRIIITLLVAAAASGCAKEKPPGPAEQIGRGLDQILGGINRMDEEAAKRPTPRRTPELEDDRDYDPSRLEDDFDSRDGRRY